MSHNDRMLQIIDSAGDDCFILTHFVGTEAISRDFKFTLHCLSNQHALPAEKWLGKRVAVRLTVNQQAPRTFNGLISKFESGNVDSKGQQQYILTLTPWFGALRLSKNCRIFQGKTVPQIFQTLCKEFGFVEFDCQQLGEHYEPLAYVVQYNESTQAFLQRILAEANIFYDYIHTQDKHVLTLFDAKSALPIQTAEYLLSETHTEPHMFEWYDFYCADGDVHANGKSNIDSVQLNRRFQLQNDHDKVLGVYYPTTITHQAHDLTHSPQQTSPELAQAYTNTLVANPASLQFRPKKIVLPVMEGPQSAIVVGPKGKPIYTDEYGRVKVQFFWDRVGENNENSSCWIRVAQMLAGDRWGSQHVPRVGDEVIVDFINADIDNPIIIGSVNHKNNPPIFDATSHDNVVSGIKTKLTNDPGLGHEFSLDDTPGKEKLCLKSAGDLTITTMNEFRQITQGNETITLNQDVLFNVLDGSHGINAQSIEINVGASQLLIDQSGVHIKPAGNLHLLADGVPSSYPIARVGDAHSCPKILPILVPHQTGPVIKGSSVVMDNHLSVARHGDPISCTGSTAKITSQISNITVDGKPIGHLNVQSDHNGKIIKGSGKTFIGPKQGLPASLKPQRVATQLIPGHHIADIVYDVTEDTYYAITATDLDSFLSAATPLMKSLHELHTAIAEELPPMQPGQGKAYLHALKLYQKGVDKRNELITKAKAKLNTVLHPMLKGEQDHQIGVQEFMRYTGLDPSGANAEGDKPWYESTRIYAGKADMNKSWFQYKMDKNIAIKPHEGESKLAAKARGFFEKYKDPSNNKISSHRLRMSIANAMGVGEQSVQLADYNWETTAKNFNTHFHFADFDGTAQAQLFRAVVHGGAKADINPKQGKLALSADGKAQFALAQGKAHLHTAIPSLAGYPISVNLPDKQNTLRPVDLGALRAYIQLELYGFVGASVAGSANLNLTLVQQGQTNVLQAKGSNQPSTTKASAEEKTALDKNGLKTSVNAFAGATAGAETGTSLQWQNPDDVVKANKITSPAVPAKTDDAIMEMCWKSLGTLNIGGSGSIGLGASAEFKVGYDAPTGKFTVKGHAQIVCGFGVSGDFGIVVDALNIEHFVAFVYHKLKDHNFNFVGFIENDAFETLQNILTNLLLSSVESLESIVENDIKTVISWWNKLLPKLQTNTDVLLSSAEQFASGINQNPEKLKYTPPEVKGRMLALFTQKNLQAKINQQITEIMAPQEPYQLPMSLSDEARLAHAQIEEFQTAMVHILSYVQSDADFKNVIQHMTLDGSRIKNADEFAKQQQLYDGLGFYGLFHAQQDPHVNHLVKELRTQTVFQSHTVPYTPVIVNQGVKAYALEL